MWMKKFEYLSELFTAKRFYFDRITGRYSLSQSLDHGRRFTCFWPHSHREIEMIYIELGAMHITIMDEHLTASAGDLLIFNPYAIHGGYVDDELPTVTYSFIRFDAGRFSLVGGDGAEDTAALWGRSELLAREHTIRCPENESIGVLIGNAVGLYRSLSESAAYEAVSGIYAILSIMQRSGYLVRSKHGAHMHNFLEKAVRFLEENYAGEITAEKIYESFPYSRSYFCRLWKRNFGITFGKSLNDYRIHSAITLYLSKPDCTLSIGEIAGKVGFTDYCQFSNIFRKYVGCSPRSYRSEILDHPTTTTAEP